MGLIKDLFGKRAAKEPAAAATPSAAKGDPSKDPSLIRVYDGYGREMFVTRQAWRDDVLLRNLDSSKGDANRLYGLLVRALDDGFAVDVVPWAEHLHSTDPVPSRGATLLGIVYMEVGRLDDAQRVLEEHVAKHGEQGVVLTNLAKVYSRRGDDARAESVLWHALELDPNQDNGFGWYVSMHRDRGGESAGLEALRRVAALPHSWRARQWLAHDRLAQKDPAGAEALFVEALAVAGRPVPTDLLMQMTGDLGKAGLLETALRLAQPLFDPAVHGLAVGNNLIKANLDLGRAEEARRILEALYAQKRPDWRPHLGFWDTELAKAGVAARAAKPAGEVGVSVLAIEGPLWTGDRSPFATLVPAKSPDAPRVAVLGSTVLHSEVSERGTPQLSDASGRLSRALPLAMAERIQLGTDAVGVALIPWAQGQGFAVFGSAPDEGAVSRLAGTSKQPPSLVVAVTVDARPTPRSVAVRLVRCRDARLLYEASAEAPAENPAAGLERLVDSVLAGMRTHAGIATTPPPAWYELPTGADASDHLLRLEQQLAVTAQNLDFLEGGGLSGEREILDGTLHLAVRNPANAMLRMVLVQTLRQMKKARPDVVREYEDAIGLLQREHPLGGDIGRLVGDAVDQVFSR